VIFNYDSLNRSMTWLSYQ